MTTELEKIFDLHVFICTNKRENGECCSAKGSEKLRHELKEILKSDDVGGKKVRVNASGCLGQCKQGISCVVYPQGKWILNLKVEDTLQLKSKIIEIATSKT